MIAAANVPPTVYVFLVLAEISEYNDWVFERLSAKRRTFQFTSFDVYLVVGCGLIVLVRVHGEEGDVLRV